MKKGWLATGSPDCVPTWARTGAALSQRKEAVGGSRGNEPRAEAASPDAESDITGVNLPDGFASGNKKPAPLLASGKEPEVEAGSGDVSVALWRTLADGLSAHQAGESQQPAPRTSKQQPPSQPAAYPRGAKLTPEQWANTRAAWEIDPRKPLAWLIEELGLPVGAEALRLRAKAEGWEKGGAAQPKLAKPKLAKVKPKLGKKKTQAWKAGDCQGGQTQACPGEP